MQIPRSGAIGDLLSSPKLPNFKDITPLAKSSHIFSLNRLPWLLLWLVLIGLSLYFYIETIVDYAKGYVPENFKRGLFDSKIWFVAHIAGASASLLLGPLQFWPTFRTRYMTWHRRAGKVFIIGSLVGAAGAFRLNMMYACEACRYSLGILSVIWFAATIAAWWAIRNKNVKAHRQFMVRSYTASLAFVFIRLPNFLGFGSTLPFISDERQVQVTYEWLCWVIPFLIIETYMNWWPSLVRSHYPKR